MPEAILGLASLQRELAAGRTLPPVEKWEPALCGEIDICILPDGSWLHAGAPILRRELVRLFSTILRKDGDAYYLVTPAEKMRIQVVDAPFLAVLLEIHSPGREQQLVFTTNVGDLVAAGRENAISLKPSRDDQLTLPYVHVRNGLDARIGRNVFYQLAEIAVAGESPFEGRMGVWSGNVFFPLELAG